MKRTKLRAVSPKRAKANREYSIRRKAFLLKHPYCQIWLALNGEDGHWLSEAYAIKHNGLFRLNSIPSQCPAATEIHHSKKPKSTYLNDESTWFSCCREMHEWVEGHKFEARNLGLLQDNH